MGTIAINNSYAALFGGDYYTGTQINDGTIVRENVVYTNYLELLPFEIKEGDLSRKNIIYIYGKHIWVSIAWPDITEGYNNNVVCFQISDGDSYTESGIADINDFTQYLNNAKINGQSLIDDIKANKIIVFEKRDGISDTMFTNFLENFRLNYRVEEE